MKMPILLANGKTNIEWVFAVKRYEPPMHSFSFSSHQKQTHTHTHKTVNKSIHTSHSFDALFLI